MSWRMAVADMDKSHCTGVNPGEATTSAGFLLKKASNKARGANMDNLSMVAHRTAEYCTPDVCRVMLTVS